MRYDERLRALWSDAVANFVGLLLQRNSKGLTSSTVQEEADGRLVSAINKLLDQAISGKRWQFRTKMIAKCRGRLKDLWSRLDIRTLKGDVPAVKAFYEALSKEPSSKLKLEELRKRKRRKDLVPGDSDMKILSEAVTLKSKAADLHFVSKDGDFTFFQKEIESKFGVQILALEDIVQFTIKLESLDSRL